MRPLPLLLPVLLAPPAAAQGPLVSIDWHGPTIAVPDPLGGAPITEGDLPGIFVAAERLGLVTSRSTGAPFGHDLNALDGVSDAVRDCNGNGVEDAVDIADGASMDGNRNGIPDECEAPVGAPYCFCPAPGVCGNPDPAAGCANSTGAGGLLAASGGTSVGADDLVLDASQLAPNGFNVLFMGPSPVPPTVLADGLRCVGGPLYRYPVTKTSAGGTATCANFVAHAAGNFPATGQITAGSSWTFQDWYRDAAGPCGKNSNVTHALAVTFTP